MDDKTSSITNVQDVAAETSLAAINTTVAAIAKNSNNLNVDLVTINNSLTNINNNLVNLTTAINHVHNILVRICTYLFNYRPN